MSENLIDFLGIDKIVIPETKERGPIILTKKFKSGVGIYYSGKLKLLVYDGVREHNRNF